MLYPKHLVNNRASVVLEHSPKFGARGLNSLHMAQDVTTPNEIHSRVFDRKRLSAADLETHAPDQIRVTVTCALFATSMGRSTGSTPVARKLNLSARRSVSCPSPQPTSKAHVRAVDRLRVGKGSLDRAGSDCHQARFETPPQFADIHRRTHPARTGCPFSRRSFGANRLTERSLHANPIHQTAISNPMEPLNPVSKRTTPPIGKLLRTSAK